MRINNKEFGEWTADDLQVLLRMMPIERIILLIIR